MASLGEMLQYAQYMGEINNPLAGIAASGLSGYFSGMERKHQKQKNDLDTYIKLLDIQDKMSKMQRENQQAEIQANMAKTFGFLPMTPDENTTAQTTAFQNLGASKNVKPDSTMRGKLSQMLDSFNKEDYEALPSYSSRNGFGFSIKKKSKDTESKMTPNQGIELRQKIRAQAEKMALSETVQKLQKSWDPIQQGSLTPNAAASYVTEDVINKYLKPAELFLTGKQSEYDKMMKKIKSETEKTIQDETFDKFQNDFNPFINLK